MLRIVSPGVDPEAIGVRTLDDVATDAAGPGFDSIPMSDELGDATDDFATFGGARRSGASGAEEGVLVSVSISIGTTVEEGTPVTIDDAAGAGVATVSSLAVATAAAA